MVSSFHPPWERGRERKKKKNKNKRLAVNMKRIKRSKAVKKSVKSGRYYKINKTCDNLGFYFGSIPTKVGYGQEIEIRISANSDPIALYVTVRAPLPGSGPSFVRSVLPRRGTLTLQRVKSKPTAADSASTKILSLMALSFDESQITNDYRQQGKSSRNEYVGLLGYLRFIHNSSNFLSLYPGTSTFLRPTFQIKKN